MKKIVLTGAMGRLGSYLREPLTKLADEVVSSDILDGPASLYAGESYVKADLSNLDEMVALLEGADMVVHFGAIGDEAEWDAILQSNIVGAYNVWEAAAQHGGACSSFLILAPHRRCCSRPVPRTQGNRHRRGGSRL